MNNSEASASSNDLQVQIGVALSEILKPFEWVSFWYEYHQAATVGESRGQWTDAAGEVHWFVDDTGVANSGMYDLRALMATTAHGTWFSMTVKATRDGDLQFYFEYDEQPVWDGEMDPAAYIEDNKRYPRPDSELPQWHPAKSSNR